METIICSVCGIEVKLPKWRAKTAKFCSQKCCASTRLGRPQAKGARKANSGSFAKGFIPWNRNKKGIHLSPESQFKKGMPSINLLPIGSITIRTSKKLGTRAFIKVADPKTWKVLSVFIWECVHGPLKKGLVIHHRDRNPLNDDIDNLQAMTRKQHIDEHRDDLQNAQRASKLK